MAALVLVIDDSNDALDLATRYLGLKGLQVVTSARTDVVTSLILLRRPDVIVLDVMMPKMSGSTLAMVIRKSMPNVPIVFYSAIQEDQGRALAQQHTGARFVSKTHGLTALLRAVQDSLQGLARAAKP